MEEIYEPKFVRAENVKFAFEFENEKKDIFTGTGMTAEEGEITYMIGPTGSGKTLMLSILCGLLPRKIAHKVDFEGEVYWGNIKVSRLDLTKLHSYRSRFFGIIFQELRLVEDLTGKDNIRFPLLIQKRDSNELFKKNKKYHDLLELEKFWNQKVKTLSGGEKQRIAIARALITDPKIIVADEPTGGLHPPMASIVGNIFEEEMNKGKIVIIVTHDDRRVNIIKEKRQHYRLDEKEGKLISPIKFQQADKMRGNDEPLDGECPRCSCKEEHWLQHKVGNTHVVIDICPDCKGVWLDAMEWDAIVSFPRTIINEIKQVISKLEKEKP